MFRKSIFCHSCSPTRFARIALASLLFAVGPAASIWGCGPDESGGDASAFESQVEDDKPIAELSDQEREQLCKDAQDYLSDRWDSSTFCTFDAHVSVAESDSLPSGDGEAQSQCKKKKQACETEFADQGGFEESECTLDSDGADCDVPVSTVEDCVGEFWDRMFESMEQMPACREVQASYYEDFESPFESFETPDSCETLNEKCPDSQYAGFGETDDEYEAEDPCGEDAVQIQYDRDNDGEMEEFCATECAENADCEEGITCNHGYCFNEDGS